MNKDSINAHFGHVHTGSLDWMQCSICNPNVKPHIIGRIKDCKKCGKQFAAKNKKDKYCDKCK